MTTPVPLPDLTISDRLAAQAEGGNADLRLGGFSFGGAATGGARGGGATGGAQGDSGGLLAGMSVETLFFAGAVLLGAVLLAR